MPKADPLATAFAAIYRADAWTNGSGPGSLPSVNRPYIAFLEAFIRNNGVRRIIDVGCGDFQLMAAVDLSGVDYIGYDVVDEVVDANRRRHGCENRSFREMPSSLEELTTGDLAIVKDVLIHLDNETSYGLLESLLRKNRFVLAVNNWSADANAYNRDIAPGAFRPVDVSLPPFSFLAATVLRYSKDCVPDPRYPRIAARLLRKHVWPGEKHVQLLLGQAPR